MPGYGKIFNMETLNKNEAKFVAELKALMEKHGVSLESSDEYDGEENHCGTNYEMVGTAAEINLTLRDLKNLLP